MEARAERLTEWRTWPSTALRTAGWARPAIAGTLILPAAALARGPINASPLMVVLAGALAVGLALLAARLAAGPRALTLAGMGALAVACWLLPWASYPGSGLVVAALFGAGAGALLRLERSAASIGAAIAGAAVLLTVRAAVGVEWAAGAAAALGVVAAFAAWREPARARRGGPGGQAALGTVATLYAAFSVFWVGSTSPSVTWFGSLTFHGPRSSMQVALTFDDGPNPPFSLQVDEILKDHGVRGTFFLVGKAVAERPDISRQMVADGQLVGNHSYDHGAVSYLDPSYPELDQTQRVIARDLGVCPAFFRPPHGTHTPFMSNLLDDRGMTLVTWDVSARDWVETDPQRLARNILEKVRPGSIILLHDGIDGNIPADRSVILQALPLILDGLKAKGYQPVTLDKLLGKPAYLPIQDCGG